MSAATTSSPTTPAVAGKEPTFGPWRPRVRAATAAGISGAVTLTLSYYVFLYMVVLAISLIRSLVKLLSYNPPTISLGENSRSLLLALILLLATIWCYYLYHFILTNTVLERHANAASEAKRDLAAKAEQLDAADKLLTAAREQIAKRDRDVATRDQDLAAKEKQLANNAARIDGLIAVLRKSDESLSQARTDLTARDAEIAELREQLAEAEDEVWELEGKEEALCEALDGRYEEIVDLESEVELLKREVEGKVEAIRELRGEIAGKDGIFAAVHQAGTQGLAMGRELVEMVRAKEEEVERVKGEMAVWEERAREKDEQLVAVRGQAAVWEETVREKQELLEVMRREAAGCQERVRREQGTVASLQAEMGRKCLAITNGFEKKLSEKERRLRESERKMNVAEGVAAYWKRVAAKRENAAVEAAYRTMLWELLDMVERVEGTEERDEDSGDQGDDEDDDEGDDDDDNKDDDASDNQGSDGADEDEDFKDDDSEGDWDDKSASDSDGFREASTADETVDDWANIPACPMGSNVAQESASNIPDTSSDDSWDITPAKSNALPAGDQRGSLSPTMLPLPTSGPSDGEGFVSSSAVLTASHRAYRLRRLGNVLSVEVSVLHAQPRRSSKESARLDMLRERLGNVNRRIDALLLQEVWIKGR
ncbi:DNA-directed RNA polymerase II subunit rpb1 [Elsinoe australis]|uniref:DNA-directed RNA polymerase II subunit rpb1 n=1 Tax=Elsinoe australis TaxID=40998 RepID=A0A2P7Z486_9PEZI|nr:DNA-directed RNA polymerase II subunit rpb1 [Elsinoe australis]